MFSDNIIEILSSTIKMSNWRLGKFYILQVFFFSWKILNSKDSNSIHK